MTQAYILLNSVQDGFWFRSPWWQSVWDQCCRSDKHHLHDDGRCMHVHSICVSLNINASMFRPSQPLLPTCDSLSQSSDKINMVWYAQPVRIGKGWAWLAAMQACNSCSDHVEVQLQLVLCRAYISCPNVGGTYGHALQTRTSIPTLREWALNWEENSFHCTSMIIEEKYCAESTEVDPTSFFDWWV